MLPVLSVEVLGSFTIADFNQVVSATCQKCGPSFYSFQAYEKYFLYQNRKLGIQKQGGCSSIPNIRSLLASLLVDRPALCNVTERTVRRRGRMWVGRRGFVSINALWCFLKGRQAELEAFARASFCSNSELRIFFLNEMYFDLFIRMLLLSFHFSALDNTVSGGFFCCWKGYSWSWTPPKCLILCR